MLQKLGGEGAVFFMFTPPKPPGAPLGAMARLLRKIPARGGRGCADAIFRISGGTEGVNVTQL